MLDKSCMDIRAMQLYIAQRIDAKTIDANTFNSVRNAVPKGYIPTANRGEQNELFR